MNFSKLEGKSLSRNKNISNSCGTPDQELMPKHPLFLSSGVTSTLYIKLSLGQSLQRYSLINANVTYHGQVKVFRSRHLTPHPHPKISKLCATDCCILQTSSGPSVVKRLKHVGLNITLKLKTYDIILYNNVNYFCK